MKQQNTNQERKSFKEVVAENKGKIIGRIVIRACEPFSFWPTFVRTKMGLAHFYLGSLDICPDEKRFWPTFFGLWPVFILKMAQLKPSNCNGSSRFGPLSHFFL